MPVNCKLKKETLSRFSRIFGIEISVLVFYVGKYQWPKQIIRVLDEMRMKNEGGQEEVKN